MHFEEIDTSFLTLLIRQTLAQALFFPLIFCRGIDLANEGTCFANIDDFVNRMRQ